MALLSSASSAGCGTTAPFRLARQARSVLQCSGNVLLSPYHAEMLPLNGFGLRFPERNSRSEPRQRERSGTPAVAEQRARAAPLPPARGGRAPARRPWPRRCAPSSTPLRTSFSSPSEQSHRCSLQPSPLSLRSTTSSRSFPRSAAKCGISTITGLARQGTALSVGGRSRPRHQLLDCRTVTWDSPLGTGTERAALRSPSAGGQWHSTSGHWSSGTCRSLKPPGISLGVHVAFWNFSFDKRNMTHLTKRNVHACLRHGPVS